VLKPSGAAVKRAAESSRDPLQSFEPGSVARGGDTVARAAVVVSPVLLCTVQALARRCRSGAKQDDRV
jgi:hypothetical protein